MPATRSTPLVRCVLIAAGLAMAAAPALGQSRQSITIRTGHVNILPVHQRFDPVVASVRVDGRNYQITERQGVRAGIIAALECRGYRVWCEGYTIVVAAERRAPRLTFESCDYRMVVREDCGTLRIWVQAIDTRPVFVEPVVRHDRYRIPEPVACPPPARRVTPPVYHRPAPMPDRRGPVTHQPPRYETEHFGVGVRFRDDDVRFDIHTGFTSGGSSRTRR